MWQPLEAVIPFLKTFTLRTEQTKPWASPDTYFKRFTEFDFVLRNPFHCEHKRLIGWWQPCQCSVSYVQIKWAKFQTYERASDFKQTLPINLNSSRGQSFHKRWHVSWLLVLVTVFVTVLMSHAVMRGSAVSYLRHHSETGRGALTYSIYSYVFISLRAADLLVLIHSVR